MKVPLNDREYLLVENRQRADADDKIKIYFSDRDGGGDLRFSKRDSVEVPFAFADSIFLDSLCDANGKNCKENKLRPRGVITGASTYDLSLPASGLLVWRVNEWFIEEFLKSGRHQRLPGGRFQVPVQGRGAGGGRRQPHHRQALQEPARAGRLRLRQRIGHVPAYPPPAA